MTILRRHWNILIALACFLLWGSFALAAKTAAVRYSGAPIYESSDSNSKVLIQLKKGQRVRVSSRARNGWHKIRVPNASEGQARVGWIRETALLFRSGSVVGDSDDSLYAKNVVFSGFGTMSLVTPKYVQSDVGLSSKQLSLTTFGFELGYRFLEEFAAHAGLEFLSLGEKFREKSGYVGKYDYSGMIFYAYPEYVMKAAPTLLFGVGAGGGTTITQTVKESFSVGDVQKTVGSNLFLLATVSMRWQVFQPVSVLVFGRYRYFLEEQSGNTLNAIGLSGAQAGLGLALEL